MQQKIGKYALITSTELQADVFFDAHRIDAAVWTVYDITVKNKYLKYYESYSAWATFAFLWEAFRSKSKLRRASLLKRLRDYAELAGKPELLGLHAKLNLLLLESSMGWDSYDYGEGYFYQSFDAAGIRGFRDTRGRVEAMGLLDIVTGQTVLEIGSNTGFLSLSLTDVAKRIVGFDINPYLVDIAKVVADYLSAGNVEFSTTTFEDLSSEETFDVVLSFANHSTYDGNTKQSIEEYFERCHSFLRPGGTLAFESHPPDLEGDGLEHVCAIIGGMFEIKERRVLQYGSFLDRNRTFILAIRIDGNEKTADR